MKVKFMQEGGSVADPMAQGAPAEGAPQEAAPQGGEEQMMQQLAGIAEQLIQQLGPEAAGAVAEMILQMLQGGQQMPAPEEQATFQRRGGRLQRIH